MNNEREVDKLDKWSGTIKTILKGVGVFLGIVLLLIVGVAVFGKPAEQIVIDDPIADVITRTTCAIYDEGTEPVTIYTPEGAWKAFPFVPGAEAESTESPSLPLE